MKRLTVDTGHADAVFAQWVAEWHRGSMALLILGMIADQPQYGYSLTVGSRRFYPYGVPSGTIYPLLRRLEHHGLVSGKRLRKGKRFITLYSITPLGRTHLRRALQVYMAEAVSLMSLANSEHGPLGVTK